MPCASRAFIQHASYLVRDVCMTDIRLASLVYVSRYCVPIAHLRQNKLFPLLYLGHAQIKKSLFDEKANLWFKPWMEDIPPNMANLIYWWHCCLLKFFSSSTFKIDGKFSGQDLGKKEAKLAWSTINWWIYLRCIIITCNNISFYLNFICRLKRSKRTWENVRRYVYCNHDKHWTGKRFCAN